MIRTTRDNAAECQLAASSVQVLAKINVTLRSLQITSCTRTCIKALIEIINTALDCDNLDDSIRDAMRTRYLADIQNIAS